MQLRDAIDAIQEAGGQVIAVGMGTPAMAANAAASEKLPFTLPVDQNLDLYRALQTRQPLHVRSRRPPRISDLTP